MNDEINLANAERARVAISTVLALRQVRGVPFSRERQEVFLAGIVAGLAETEAAAAAGVSPASPYRLMREDPEFRDLYEDAKTARAGLAEDRLLAIALYGRPDAMATVRAAEVWLKGNHPTHAPIQKAQGATGSLRRLPDGSMALSVTTGDFMRS